jgi:predicted metal-binding membrane protein
MAVRERESTRSVLDVWVVPALLAVAALGWWWSASAARDMDGGMSGDMSDDMSDDMTMAGAASMSLVAFLVAWVAMLAAMMLPAVLPVIRLYSRAAGRETVAPVPFFLAGYAVVWSSVGIPAFIAWRRLDEPLADATPTAGRIAGGVLVAAAIYQLSPVKQVCLRHCRSPLSFFMEHGKNLQRPSGAVVAGARHGLFCLGCCWMLMAVLVAFGTMQLAWMVGLAAIILLEKASPMGERVAGIAGIAFLILGAVLLLDPTSVSHLT